MQTSVWVELKFQQAACSFSPSQNIVSLMFAIFFKTSYLDSIMWMNRPDFYPTFSAREKSAAWKTHHKTTKWNKGEAKDKKAPIQSVSFFRPIYAGTTARNSAFPLASTAVANADENYRKQSQTLYLQKCDKNQPHEWLGSSAAYTTHVQ